MVINEFPRGKIHFPILLVEILICEGLFLSKASKHGSNAYNKLSMISSPNPSFNQRIMIIENLIIMVINEVL